MSQERVRETSAGESGSALLNGSSTWSMRSLNDGFSGTTGRSTPRDLRRAASNEEGAYAAAANENTAIATAANMMMDISNIASDLNLNNPSNYKVSDCLQG